MVKVINTRNRLYNWVKKWGIIDISKEDVLEYTIAWFVIVEEKQNILKNKITTENFDWVDEVWTIEELKEKLDHLWVDFAKCKNKTDYQKLLSETFKNLPLKKVDTIEEIKDIEALKIQLINDKIVEFSEIENKSESEIIQIATDNWLI